MGLRLQFFLQLPQKLPVRALRYNFLWARLDHPRLVETKRPEPDRVFGIVLAPTAVRETFYGFERVIVVFGYAFADNGLGNLLGRDSADLIRVQNGANGALRGDRVLSHKLPVAYQHAAKVLRPRPVYGAIHNDAPDLFRAKLLRLCGESQVGIDLPFREELHRLAGTMFDPVDVSVRIQTDVRHHAREERIRTGVQRRNGHRPSLEVAYRPDALAAQQLEAADMFAAQHHNGISGFEPKDNRGREMATDVGFAGSERALDSLGSWH